MAAPTLYRLLADVDAGLVTFQPSIQWIGVPDYVPVADGEDYRLAVLDAINRSQVGLTGRGNVLVVSSLGEHFQRHANPDRYRSATAVEVRDGKVEQRAVTA